MTDVRTALLALPPPAAAGATGLRASLRSAAAMPVEPVQAARQAPDPAFRDGIEAVDWGQPSDRSDPTRFVERRAERVADGFAFTQFLSDPSVPFLAQQLGQGMRLLSPTLDANAEVAAYAAAQQRADRAAQGQQALLDVHA